MSASTQRHRRAGSRPGSNEGERPLLFVAMPFGSKRDPTGRTAIDFDQVYERAIKPAADRARVEVIRADEERTGGFIHRPMYERLLLAEIVIADLTFANPNVFYELGIRHAAKPRSTILTFATIGTLPFDVAPIRALPYQVSKKGKLTAKAADALSQALTERLERAKDTSEQDSPLFQLLPGFPGILLPPDATDAFRDRARAVSRRADQMRDAVRLGDKAGVERLHRIERQIGDLRDAPRELPVDLLLAYRDVSAWDDMVRVVEAMPEETRDIVTVREQLAFALNRRDGEGDRQRAIGLLRDVLRQYGPAAETSGILGRCWKDAWEDATDPDEKADALDKAIAAYGEGFEADPREYYPGVNLVTLLLNRGTPEDLARIDALVPVVQFAVARRGGLASQDYWDRATVLELAVIGGDRETAKRTRASLSLGKPPSWMLKSTARNLRLLIEPVARAHRNARWVRDLANALAPPDR